MKQKRITGWVVVSDSNIPLYEFCFPMIFLQRRKPICIRGGEKRTVVKCEISYKLN